MSFTNLCILKIPIISGGVGFDLGNIKLLTEKTKLLPVIRNLKYLNILLKLLLA